MSDSAAIVHALSIAYPSARILEKRLPSGTVWIDIWRGEQFISIECSPTLGYGVSLVKDDDPGFDGHESVFADAAEVVRRVCELLGSTEADGQGT